jgi:hypothetical protein
MRFSTPERIGLIVSLVVAIAATGLAVVSIMGQWGMDTTLWLVVIAWVMLALAVFFDYYDRPNRAPVRRRSTDG